MSALEPGEVIETTRGLKRKRFSHSEQDDLSHLDDIFKRIKTAVPRAPYILSTPSLNPYRYHSQHEANAWMMGRFWQHDEVHKQYRTYLYREPCQDCFELQAGEDDEPEMEGIRSKASNTIKKKMNLSAFKVKQVNGNAMSMMKKDAPNPVLAEPASEHALMVKEPEDASASMQGKDSKSPTRPSTHVHDESRTRKASNIDPCPEVQDTLRLSREKETTQPKSDTGRPNSSSGTPHGLPPLLSPVDAPLGNLYGLPDILSPTLPSNIQAELVRLEHKRKTTESSAPTSSQDPTSQSSITTNTQSRKFDNSRNFDSQEHSGLLNEKTLTRPASRQAERKKPNLIAKLKFSRAKIPTVKQILRLPPKRSMDRRDRLEIAKEVTSEGQTKQLDRPVIKKKLVSKVATRRPPDISSQEPLSTTNDKSPAAPTKILEKRPRIEDDAASSMPAKRSKTSMDEGSSTPVQHTILSSISAERSAQKRQQYVTPKKDIKAVSMLRTQSAESHDSTPGRSGNTPAGAKVEKVALTSSPWNNKKQADVAMLAQMSMKLNHMGRELKHEAAKVSTTVGKELMKQVERQTAVTNLECILSYMAAYYAHDLSLSLRGRASEVEQTWKTLLPLCLSYTRGTKQFRHLDGLRSYLGAVIASTICTHVSQRASASRPHDSPQDVAHAELAKQHTSLAENFALLSDHTMKMRRHFADARVALPMEELQNGYSKTWAARELESKMNCEVEKISGPKMSGPYFLPLSVDTTPIQAVRFGLKFLSEYCEKEKLEYSQRVALDQPE